MEELRFFSILDKNNRVINIVTFPKNPKPSIISEEIDGNLVETEIIPKPEDILFSYPEEYSILEYSKDKSITNNEARIDNLYNPELNAFVSQKPDDTYLLNKDTFEWEPNPEIEYDIHNDGNLYKWIRTGWIMCES